MRIDEFTRPPGEEFRLGKFDPGSTGDCDRKRDAADRTKENLDRLNELQEQLYAGDARSLLIVLQAMDAAGKDGAIKHVMGAFNPQGVRVWPFKVPSDEERAHDFLWRIHHRAPRRGMIAIYNRSHYEDVLVVRVKGLVPKKTWGKRYRRINDFERLLADSGTRIVKFFLNVSRDEQADRFRKRQSTPSKQWKFSPGDLEERKLWDDYQEAYEEALTRCNTRHAPWYVVPADHKWYRNLVVSEVLVHTLESMDLSYPDPVPGIEDYVVE